MPPSQLNNKELQEELEKLTHTHAVYILYTPPIIKVLFINQIFVLTPLLLPSKKKILYKERERHLKS